MVCKKCGKELTQEMIDANLCWSCGDIIVKSKMEDIIDHDSITEIESNNETVYNNETKNTIGNILNVLGILVLILGTIGSFSLSGGNGRYYSFTFSVFIIYEFATILSGFFFIGIAQIIQLLHKINNKLK